MYSNNMKGGKDTVTANPSSEQDLKEKMQYLSSVTDIEIKHIIRCCYKSKTVSDKMISELTTNKDVVIAKLMRSERFQNIYGRDDKFNSLPVSYLSPIEDE